MSLLELLVSGIHSDVAPWSYSSSTFGPSIYLIVPQQKFWTSLFQVSTPAKYRYRPTLLTQIRRQHFHVAKERA